MKKFLQFSYGKILLVVAACGFFVCGKVEAGAGASGFRSGHGGSADTAQLTVWRAADFGYWIHLNLYIDGVQVTSLGWNEGYRALVRPGEHVLSIIAYPGPYGKTRVTYRRVNMKRGENYGFTAIWEEAQLPVLASGHVRVASSW